MKTVVFDFGNVVAFFDHYRTLEKLTPYTDMTAQEMYAAVYGGELEDAIECGRLTRADFLRQLIDVWRLRCDADYLARAVADIFTPNPEVCDLLPRLKGRYCLLLGSNTNELHAAHFTRQFEAVLANFDALVMSHQVGVRKPKPGFFEACQKLARGGPAECVFIDDLPANVEGARAHGWQGIVYRPGEDLVGKLRMVGVE